MKGEQIEMVFKDPLDDLKKAQEYFESTLWKYCMMLPPEEDGLVVQQLVFGRSLPDEITGNLE